VTGVPTSFGSYDELLASREIDAVYNALPNGLHAHWSIRAAEAGKHVLCEKPLAASVAEVRAMFAAARRHNVHLVEAYPYRSQPQTHLLKRLIADGAIGRVRMVHAVFAFPLTDRGNIRFDPVLAGGALMDLGSYPLSLIRMIAGQAPSIVHALGTVGPSGVDTSAIVSMAFPDGLLAQAACSFDTVVHRQALIAGDNGLIETTYANHTDFTAPVVRIRRGGDRAQPFEELTASATNGFLAEAESFAELVSGGEWNGISEAESVDVAAMLDSARAQLPGFVQP
jgi:predicted dehydrogenase